MQFLVISSHLALRLIDTTAIQLLDCFLRCYSSVHKEACIILRVLPRERTILITRAVPFWYRLRDASCVSRRWPCTRLSKCDPASSRSLTSLSRLIRAWLAFRRRSKSLTARGSDSWQQFERSCRTVSAVMSAVTLDRRTRRRQVPRIDHHPPTLPCFVVVAEVKEASNSWRKKKAQQSG